MAQTATMGPPLSPVAKEAPRRSGRRPALNTFSSSANGTTPSSRSPDSPREPSRPKESHQRSNSNSSTRSKRTKQEDADDAIDDHGPVLNGHGSGGGGNGNGNGKKRKGSKDNQVLTVEVYINQTPAEDPPIDEEEGGSVRCYCGRPQDDQNDGEEYWMIQCETCHSWQHGVCMGYDSQDACANEEYHCEECRPDMHEALLKKLAKRNRQASNASHHDSRPSRSRSPSHPSVLKPAKRRNTMNSRDAAYDESLLQEVIQQSAAEAAAAEAAAANGQTVAPYTNHINGAGDASGHGEDEDDLETARKKRKRTEDDAVSTKRNRSTSSASDHPVTSNTVPRDETPAPPASMSRNVSHHGGGRGGASRNKRGGARKALQALDLAPLDVEEGLPPPTSKRGANGRGKAGAQKRPPASYSGHVPGVNGGHEHGTRGSRAHGSNAASGPASHSNARASTSAAASRAYHQTHEYAVSQQPLLTSWHLPDYLAHLEHILPSREPAPLTVQSSGMGGLSSLGAAANVIGSANSASGRDRNSVPPDGVTFERGVKIKWPAKRMSVGDMNKRVRALVEWVGREQALASERIRRREALEKALTDIRTAREEEAPTVLEGGMVTESPLQEKTENNGGLRAGSAETGQYSTQQTMKLMEELMEELISFQERFGPGAKTKERERRIAVA